MVVNSLSSSSRSKFSYTKLRRQASSEVLQGLTTTCCFQRLKWWKLVAIFVFFTLSFLFILFSLYTGSTLRLWARRRTTNPHHRSILDQRNFQRSILVTDRALRLLAANERLPIEEYVHPNANISKVSLRGAAAAAFGPQMNSAREMVQAIEVTTDIRRPCSGGGGDLLVVIFLFCVAGDFSRRQVIRETYGSALKANPATELYFVLGQTRDKDDRLEAQLRNESRHHNDILQFAFTDAYFNLTLKAVTTLRWAALRCSHARFAFKLDSDAYIRLRPFLAEVANFSVSSLYGQLRHNEYVLRDPSIKWAIDPRYWPYEHYPPLLAGPYLVPVAGGAASQLYAAVAAKPTTDTLPALPIDDAYITGVLAEKANLSRALFPGLKMLWGEEKKLLLREDNGTGKDEKGKGEGKEKDKEAAFQLRKNSVFFETLTDDDLLRLWRVFGDG